MKKIIFICIIIFFQQSFKAQKKYIGIDLGYQFGKNQYLESGLNLTLISKKIGGSLSFGIEDNLNSKSLGYKLGISGFLTKPKSPPLYLGVNLINYKIDENNFKYIRPEVGISGPMFYLGRGNSRINLIYGYNLKIKDGNNDLNNHLVRVSINSNLRGLIELIGFGAYKFASIFVSNWS